ncbi:hypothetical protein [Saccharophagus degradans]|uniref:Uncharacterized protein n=1 Tax=Saccharophagus degradans (strain 2-40 / ATCC 43961 / DSM 17024) TaxID=203122 RepID=Q21P12_SACD2|nr:hypothetical protein [Saccharophagus degradans]ABD79567.1 hypothetical protein Sde_0303 [Saccharophagus degradans 2-40]
MLYALLTSVSDDEPDEEDTVLDWLYYINSLFGCVALICVSILFYQILDSVVGKWSFIVLAAYALIFVTVTIFEELSDGIKILRGDTDSDEQGGVIANLIGCGISLACAATGGAIAIVGVLRILPTLG